MPQELTLGAVVTVALGSSVLGSLLTQAGTWWRERAGVERETAYLALRAAVVLERFAEDVAEFVEAIDRFNSGAAEGVSTDLPSLRPLPDEKERWRDLDVRLTSRIIGFEERLRSRQLGIDATWEFASPHDGIEAAKGHALVLAVSAIRLAVDVRRRHGLPAFDTISIWPEFISSGYDDLPGHWHTDENG